MQCRATGRVVRGTQFGSVPLLVADTQSGASVGLAWQVSAVRRERRTFPSCERAQNGPLRERDFTRSIGLIWVSCRKLCRPDARAAAQAKSGSQFVLAPRVSSARGFWVNDDVRTGEVATTTCHTETAAPHRDSAQKQGAQRAWRRECDAVPSTRSEPGGRVGDLLASRSQRPWSRLERARDAVLARRHPRR
jgi:hypothetical protein